MAIVLIRAVILYAVITFSLRLMGKRQLGELQPSELVVTILISNIASIPVEDPSVPMLMGIVPIFALVCIDVILSAVMLGSPRFRRVIIGSPRVIISEGRVLQKEMKRLRYTVDDLVEAMREQQIFDIGKVRYAIVETTGKINFLEKDDADSKGDPPSVVIRDGVVDREQLDLINLTDKWLDRKLKEHNVLSQQVFLMTADSAGEINLIIKDGAKG